MPVSFLYKARDPLGHLIEGTLEASSQEEATQRLRRDGFQVVMLEEEGGELAAIFGRRVTKTDIIYLTNQLAIMVETGITIADALETIAEQEDSPALQRMLKDLKEAVEGGEDFSTALARHPKYFDETYVALIRASEATGTLGAMLDRIAGYMRSEKETRGKVRSALTYPCAMLTLSIGVTTFLLTYIMPKFEPLFSRPGVKLPKSTKMLMAVSDTMIGQWYFWIAGVIALIVGFVLLKRTASGKRFFDYAKIHTPVFGPLFRKVAISRSIRTLGTMMASGVSVLDSLQLCADVSGNCYYRELWLDVLDQVTSGKQICEAVAGNPLLPPMLVRMISSGEDTGKLDVVLDRVSAYYDNEVDTAIKTATSLIEPVMISFMGVVVGGIAMSLLLPIFSLSKPG
jgi:type IV pilus assembly protein PilC